METVINSSVWMMVSEVELIYKSKVKASQRPKITQSADAYQLFLHQWDENKLEFVEQFKVMFLNRANRVLGICDLFTGGISLTVADPKIIFSAALKANASSIIVCHNHPSGHLTPSCQDEDLTYRLKQAGQFLELPLIDHLIISNEGFLSFAEEGLL
jgi:DNA repair protein RadC